MPSGLVEAGEQPHDQPDRVLAMTWGDRLGRTIAFLAECAGSASIDEQRASLDADDQVVLAGKLSFATLERVLRVHGVHLEPGDRVKVYDLGCLALATGTLVRLLSKLLAKGVAFEIVTARIVIQPDSDDRLFRFVEALDHHHRRVHGIKTHPPSAVGRGRRRLLAVEQLEDIRAMLAEPGTTATQVASRLGVARSTLFNFLDRFDGDRPGRGVQQDM